MKSIIVFCLLINSLKSWAKTKSFEPKERFVVNRTYNDQGHLVHYDSTHYYSKTWHDTMPINAQQLLGEMQMNTINFVNFFDDSLFESIDSLFFNNMPEQFWQMNKH